MFGTILEPGNILMPGKTFPELMFGGGKRQ